MKENSIAPYFRRTFFIIQWILFMHYPGTVTFAQLSALKIPLIPIPEKVQMGKGIYKINPGQKIFYNDQRLSNDLLLFNDYLYLRYGFRLNTEYDSELKPGNFNVSYNAGLQADHYVLSVDSNEIRIDGGKNAGVCYAFQTLIQLLPPGKVREVTIPSIHIEDGPRFAYRGMHLDVSRHFFSVESVKRYIDWLLLYKMNVFHWHLTDDQGWRIEIKKYPKLQTIGAWRKGTLIGHKNDRPEKFDSLTYGGFYTQEQITEIVNYAAARHIEIIPEVEMPGHALAALASYPEFSCTGGPFETGKKWGVFKDVFCPKEETFAFLENVLDEVCSLFPGKYIHIGGDECPKDRWKECSHCQELIKKENLSDENGLQGYFTNRISAYLKLKNKTAIGWDEILNKDLDSNAVILSWRGYRGAVDAAGNGHQVIMAPYSHCYFDYYQTRFTEGKLAIGDFLPLDRVYSFDPVPDVLNRDQAKLILGAQGNVWTEYITTDDYLQEMVFPRICALAEVLWSPAESRDYKSFTTRVVSHFKFLKFNSIRYSPALFDIDSRVSPLQNGIAVELFSTYPFGKIFYTVNGDEPQLSSSVYTKPIAFDQSVSIRAALFEGVQKKSSNFKRSFSVNLATGKEIVLANQPHEEYSRGGAQSLVNGVTGDLPWIASEWLGFLGQNLDATVDLGSAKTVSRVAVDVLKDEDGKIFLPKDVSVMLSLDGKEYVKAGKIGSDEIEKMKRRLKIQFPPSQARWIKIVATNFNGKDWLFVDEIFAE